MQLLARVNAGQSEKEMYEELLLGKKPSRPAAGSLASYGLSDYRGMGSMGGGRSASSGRSLRPGTPRANGAASPLRR